MCICAPSDMAEEGRWDVRLNAERYHFNVAFLRRFWHVLRVMFPRWRSITVLLFCLLLCIVILGQVVIYNVGQIPSKYYKVLGDKDQVGFRDLTLFSALLIISIAFVTATETYVCAVLRVTWRDCITRYLHRLYFRDILYYKLNVLTPGIDNPDQRMTQDVDKMCNEFSQIVARLLISPFTIAYYTYNTWNRTGYLGPLCVLVFFLVSTVFNKLLMSPVAAMVFRQERLEGDFRYKHMQMRVNAEQAAFLRCGEVERSKTDKKLGHLIKTQHRLMMKEYLLNFAIQSADYLGSILSYIILAIPIFSGVYDDLSAPDLSALISSNSFVTMYLINCFTRLIDMAARAAAIAGTTHRIGELMEVMNGMLSQDGFTDCASSGTDGPANGGITMQVYHPNSNTSIEQVSAAYSLNHVSYGAPGDEDPLVTDISLKVVSGVNLLITGDSGCGKSSLLRVLDGLWPLMKGHVERGVFHGSSGVIFLPQKPFFTDGCLREQITYPANGLTSRVDDMCIIDYLKEADLMGLYDRVGGLDVQVQWNWYDMLSPGEMQRLSFVRLFYHKPPFAILDEATSQIGLDAERTLYERCRELSITTVSVGHRASLRDFHDIELHLTGKGDWTLETINDIKL